MEKRNGYDTKRVKKEILDYAMAVWYQIGRLEGEYAYFEQGLVRNALLHVLDEDTGSEDQFLQLLSISYMLRGIEEMLCHLPILEAGDVSYDEELF